MIKLKNKPCRICGNPVKKKRRKDRKAFYYPKQCPKCRYKCREEQLRRKRISKSLSGVNHPRSRPIGSRRKVKCGNCIYWQIKTKPTGKWPFEHRAIMEKTLKRNLKTFEHIHHINGNTLDNNPENLILINKSEHSKIHCPFHK